MGDHRASIKIEMKFHGKTETADMYINYCDEDGNGIDSRVAEFFRKCYNEGMDRYHQEMEKYWAKENAEKIKAQEIQELARLKEKYEPR